MEYRQNGLMKKVLVILALAFLTAGVGLALRRVLAQSDDKPPRKHVEAKVEWLKKEAAIDKHNDWLTPSVTIQLSGLQDKDYVNIRPTENSAIEATAGAIPNLSAGSPKHSEPLPESALKVSPGEVTFDRPVNIESPIVLDIQIPSGKETKVIADNDVILSASLHEPLSIRGKQVGQGVSTITAAMAQTMLPSLLPFVKNRSLGQLTQNTARPLGKSGKYMVPFYRLQVVKKVALNGTPLETIARLEIDETGHVVKVQPMGSTPAPNLEETLKQWEFAPYLVDGHPVRVITQFTPADQ